MNFEQMSNFELLDCYYMLRAALDDNNKIVLAVQEELFIRMEE